MGSRLTKVVSTLAFLSVLGGTTLLVRWYFATPSLPSPLVAEAALSKELGSRGLQSGPRFLLRHERWRHDAVSGLSERSFDGTVFHLDGSPVDPSAVGARVDESVARFVRVDSIADDSAGPGELCRVIRYGRDRVTGQVRYVVKPAPRATFVRDGEETRAELRSLEVRVSERQAR